MNSTDQPTLVDEESSAEQVRKRTVGPWVKRQLEYWLGSKAPPVIAFLVACHDVIGARAVYARLLSDQQKIRAANAQLLADQATIKAHNEYLEHERDWLSWTNEQLRAQQAVLMPAASEPEAKLKIAPGLLSRMDMDAITSLAKMVPAGGTIVDVGSLLGMSASLWCIHSSARRIVCVDPWQYEPWLKSFRDANGPITKEAFLAYVPDERIETIQGYSPACAAGWNDPIDLYWEDGDHNNPACAASIRFWSRYVKPGGIACGHDYHWSDVKAEADALAAEWGATLQLFGTVWWIRKPG